MNLSVHIVLAALAVALVALTGGIAACLYHLRIKKRYARCLATRLREQDRVERELERTRIEKATLESVLLTKLSGPAETPGTPGTKNNNP